MAEKVRGIIIINMLAYNNPPVSAALLSDLHAYDPLAKSWTDLSAAASGTPPSAREAQGFASDGRSLYVHGGLDGSGEPTWHMR